MFLKSDVVDEESAKNVFKKLRFKQRPDFSALLKLEFRVFVSRTLQLNLKIFCILLFSLGCPKDLGLMLKVMGYLARSGCSSKWIGVSCGVCGS